MVIGSGGMIDAVVNKLIQKIGADESACCYCFPVAEELDLLPFLTPKTCTAASKIVE